MAMTCCATLSCLIFLLQHHSASSFPYLDAIVKYLGRCDSSPPSSTLTCALFQKHYLSPHTFNPDHFMNLKENTLDKIVKDADYAVFSFGRRWVGCLIIHSNRPNVNFVTRLCPGQHTAYSLLCRVFDIQPILNDDGAAIKSSSWDDTTGIVRFVIVVRWLRQ